MRNSRARRSREFFTRAPTTITPPPHLYPRTGRRTLVSHPYEPIFPIVIIVTMHAREFCVPAKSFSRFVRKTGRLVHTHGPRNGMHATRDEHGTDSRPVSRRTPIPNLSCTKSVHPFRFFSVRPTIPFQSEL